MMKIAKILNFAPEGQRAERSFGSAAGERSLLPLKAKKGPKDFFCFPAEGRRGRRPPGAEGPRSELSQTSKSLTSLASCLKSLASRLKSLASLTSLTSKIGTGLLLNLDDVEVSPLSRARSGDCMFDALVKAFESKDAAGVRTRSGAGAVTGTTAQRDPGPRAEILHSLLFCSARA